jgi:hypothetical protein
MINIYVNRMNTLFLYTATSTTPRNKERFATRQGTLPRDAAELAPSGGERRQ